MLQNYFRAVSIEHEFLINFIITLWCADKETNVINEPMNFFFKKNFTQQLPFYKHNFLITSKKCGRLICHPMTLKICKSSFIL